MNKQLKAKEASLHLDPHYKEFLATVKTRLKTAQVRAALAVNNEQLRFYWQLGRDIIEKQQAHAWGDRFLEQFSHDLRQAFPEMRGFSITTLKRMRLFAREYSDFEIGAQAVHQLPWGHIVLLLHKIDSKSQRDWYAIQTVQNGWSRDTLAMQIMSGLYERQGINDTKLTNFHECLPARQSELANQILKDPYHFDFLTLHDQAHERAIEDALVAHVRNFLLELGQGFAFVGSQVPLTFDDQEYFIDLLFYHLNLRSFVVIELKAGKFKPEHTGQLGFYLAVVDDKMKKEYDNPTIGILLCKSKNKVVAEYALRNIKAPIGVSEYTFSKALPKELKTSLPSVDEIEAELNEAIGDKVPL